MKLSLKILFLLISLVPLLANSQEVNKFSGGKSEGSDKGLMTIDEQPSYPGGDAERVRFLMKNIRYPVDAKLNCEQGTVYVSFVVEKDGSITNIEILRGVCPSIDAETIRVVSLMPKWKPGKQDGDPVRVRFSMPVKFTLAGDCVSKENKMYNSAMTSYNKQDYIECKQQLEELISEYPHHQKAKKLLKKVNKKLKKQ
ncbi:MAG: TonB family protein [Bacteroidales bacterium]|nr:TonB family protein [Bacteroidales bacterium]